MKIKKDDKIIVIAGKDKGKTGKVLKVISSENKVVVEGVNIAKRHKKGTQQGQTGQILEIAMPIDVSNVAIVDPKTKKATRIRIEKKDGKRVRVSVKSGSIIK